MLSINLKKYITSLHRAKYRQKYNNFLAEGTKLVLEIISDHSNEVEMLICTQEWANKHINTASTYSFDIHIVESKEIKSLSQFSTGADVLCVMSQKPFLDFGNRLISDQWSVYLDDVQDPGNVGTILRICDWFGISRVITSENSAHPYNPKVVQASMGAILRLDIIRANFKDFINDLESIPTYATVLQGTSMYDINDTKPGIIVIGNESKGVQPLIRNHAQYRITIPRKGKAESLNAAVATGIIVSYLCR